MIGYVEAAHQLPLGMHLDEGPSLGRMAVQSWRATHGGREAVAAAQQERLARIVTYARERSPYYRHHYRDVPHEVTDPALLPPTTKGELMAAFDDWVTDPAVTRAAVEAWIADEANIGQMFLDRYLVWTTSGTTGEPAILVQDMPSLDLMDALRVRMVRAALSLRTVGAALRGVRAAVIFATGGHYGGVTSAHFTARRNPAVRNLRIFPVQTPLDQLVADLNEFQPDTISAYASALVLLAHEQLAGRLRIAPASVMSTAEMLRPPDRLLVEQALNCKLIEGYGASEAPAIALQCTEGQLHVNEDWFILEPVDRDLHAVPAGERSDTVLVTNLVNHVQPVLRYDLGDSVVIDPEPCRCGSPLAVVRVEGRTDEILTLTPRDGEPRRLAPLGVAVVVEQTAGVRRYQVVQTAEDALQIRMEPLSGFDDARVWQNVERRMKEYLAVQGLPDVSVERAAEPPARDPRSGKFRHVWVDIPPKKAPSRRRRAR